MKGRIAAAIAIFLLIYSLLQWGIGWHGAAWLRQLFPGAGGAAFWLPFALLAYAYLIGRVLSVRFDAAPLRALMRLGAYWMAAMVYLILMLPAADLAVWLLGLAGAKSPALFVGWCVVVALVGLIGYGSWNAWRPVAREFRLRVRKPAAGRGTLRIAVASDLHLGALVGRRHLRRLVRDVNAFEPDLVLLPGDLLDDDLAPFVKDKLADVFRGFRARLGVYAVTGNHDPFGGSGGAAFAEAMASSGIRMLMDETLDVGGELTLVGRLDRSAGRYGLRRADLEPLLAGADRRRPVVLMDHQPLGFAEAEAAGVDLMLSGHTHRGQLAPGHLITRRLFDLDWGYVSRGAFHAIVSSGYGFWGPPIRIGSRSEWIQITLELEA
ncbi:metallophosphoesterase [Paenibacillus sp.]|uniref:metallophosphoesterase n=1 Tax=Paenibacillus sp. TaxID=58172 RepID=UPI0028124EDC|nr:metallophosphoesterase [Paenibacillus sp.]